MKISLMQLSDCVVLKHTDDWATLFIRFQDALVLCPSIGWQPGQYFQRLVNHSYTTGDDYLSQQEH